MCHSFPYNHLIVSQYYMFVQYLFPLIAFMIPNMLPICRAKINLIVNLKVFKFV